MASNALRALGPRLTTMVVSLLVLGLAWYLLKLDHAITLAIGGVIIAGALSPVRVAAIVSGLGFLAIAGVLEFHYGWRVGAIILAVIGVIDLVRGAAILRGMRV